ncbi:MAG TPA: hypothetical protein PKN56_26825 [Leptospiraceae bacterium]|nr:hypothetical protein [Leptospiraceae bacterium]HNF28412.1 hypothetical protein [Leptospiraceae bacterium]HNM06573.1 hypothetical protein [Leptospiraceae bacterium]HNN07196.1 hypothetical protein [Leptospiraceae bacterium]
MREYPILFNSEMVNAILHGTANTKAKTQTRRTKGLEEFEMGGDKDYWNYEGITMHCNSRDHHQFTGISQERETVCCPYGGIGDRLWIRETFAIKILQPGNNIISPIEYIYKADYSEDKDRDLIGVTRWKPAIHMPREASRITLEIMDIRLERLQEISDADAIAEGIVARNYSAKEAYLELWDSIHGKDAHKLNPFVWVIEFKRLEAL